VWAFIERTSTWLTSDSELRTHFPINVLEVLENQGRFWHLTPQFGRIPGHLGQWDLVRRAAIPIAALALIGAAFAQRPFRQFAGVEYERFQLPPDWNEKTEFVFARLMYPWNGWGFRYGNDWTGGASHWTIDYPRSDRHVVQAIRRLSRRPVGSDERQINLDEGDQ